MPGVVPGLKEPKMNWKAQATAAIDRDAPVATAAAAEHPDVAGLKAAAIAFAARMAAEPSNTFLLGKSATCADIAAKLARYGSYASAKQADFAAKLILWSKQGQPAMQEPRPAAIAPEAVPAPAPTVLPALTALLAPGKLARFYVGNWTMKLTQDAASIWIRNKALSPDRAVGRIDTATGILRLFGRADTAENVAALVTIDADPLAAVKGHGTTTGVCGCCGRMLVDPVSVAAGIGPICAARGWGINL
jgi:hypothetical protein